MADWVQTQGHSFESYSRLTVAGMIGNIVRNYSPQQVGDIFYDLQIFPQNNHWSHDVTIVRADAYRALHAETWVALSSMHETYKHRKLAVHVCHCCQHK